MCVFFYSKEMLASKVLPPTTWILQMMNLETSIFMWLYEFSSGHIGWLCFLEDASFTHPHILANPSFNRRLCSDKRGWVNALQLNHSLLCRGLKWWAPSFGEISDGHMSHMYDFLVYRWGSVWANFDVLKVVDLLWFQFVWFYFRMWFQEYSSSFGSLSNSIWQTTSFSIWVAFLPASICWVSRSTLTVESQMNGIGSGNKGVIMPCQKTDEYSVGCGFIFCIYPYLGRWFD